MKKSFLFGLVFLYTSVFAVEGYKDIYINSNKDIYVHTIYCAKDLSTFATLQPSVIFTNTKDIEDGTYYFDSMMGKFSTTFKHIDGESNSIRVRGILTKGKTSKEEMIKEVCLVDKNEKLPKYLNGKIQKDLIKANDTSWNNKMKQLTNYFGKPASAKGKYLSQK